MKYIINLLADICATLSWNRVSETVLRCISMSFSENLTELDLSESQVLSTHLELLLVRCSRLKVRASHY